MIILQVKNATKRFNGEDLFTNVNLTIQDNSRIALVGRNGAGKSTLIKMIMDQTSIDGGEITKKKDLSIGYLAQDTGLESDKTVYAEMESVFAGVKQLENQLHEVENQMGTTTDQDQLEQLATSYDRLSAEFERQNGYGYAAEIRGVLHGFGFDEPYYDHFISELSGGQKTQLALAKLLLEKPELLILDEPTNHLDVATITWLEGYIQKYSGALLIISHDRYFLDKLVNEVYDLAHNTLHHYKGNYSDYITQKAQLEDQQERAYEKQQAEIQKLQTFVDKNIVRASSTKQAQARRKQLAKMDRIDRPNSDEKVAHFTFSGNRKSGHNVLKVTDAAVGYDNNVLAEPVNLDITANQAVAIVGPNGIGKSTLLKSILGIIPFIKGNVAFGTGVDTGYYDQEQQSLHNNKTVLAELWDEHPTTPEKDIRSILGSFLFSGDDVLKQVRDLSGGEKARLLLTKLAMKHDNFLILDEPTNHLDIDSREVLETALKQFDGTILFVSHDRYFINQVATSVIEISPEGSTAYLGNYDYYVEKKDEQLAIKARNEEQKVRTDITTNNSSSKNNYQLGKEAQKKRRKMERQVQDLEHQLAELKDQRTAIEEQMVSIVQTDYEELGRLQAALDDNQAKTDEVEMQWTEKSIELEELLE